MDWLEFLQIICVPAFIWLVHRVGNVQKELNDFKVQVAREYATQVHITRLELKIDELRQLIWEIHNESKTTKRDLKQQPRKYPPWGKWARVKSEWAEY